MKLTTPLIVLALGGISLMNPDAATAQSALSTEALQLPRAMHAPMKEHARLTVGVRSGDMVGSDNRALQAAVDYVSGLGGGVVEIGPGEYLMRDSLHLRPHVTGDAA